MPAQRRQGLSVQASPSHTVGSCSQTAPHGGNPNSISTLLTPQRREKPQPREGLSPQGHTASESLWQHSRLPTQGPASSDTQGASGSKVRSADKANANSGDPAQEGRARNGTVPQVLRGAQGECGQDL